MTVCSIIIEMHLLLLILVNIFSVILERIFISAGFVEFDIAFIKYAYWLLGIIDIVIILLAFVLTSVLQPSVNEEE